MLIPLAVRAEARRALLVGCLALNLGVAFGLVRRGYHWPLDVAASWCLCAVLLLFSLRLLLGRNTSVGTGVGQTAVGGRRRQPK